MYARLPAALSDDATEIRLSPRTPATDRRDAWVVSALVVAAAVRVFRLDAAPLWLDEVVTARWILLPWRDMLQAVLTDNHPPLYFAVLKAWVGVAGTSAWAMRLPSVVASWAAVPLVAALADTFGGRTAARWAAWLAALSPFLVHHGQETRMYAFVAAFAAAQLLLLARFVTGRSASLGTAFVLSAAALVWTHYYGALLIAAELLVLVVVRRRPSRSWLPAAAGAALAVLAAAVVAWLLAIHHTGGAYQPGLYALPGIAWSLLTGYGLLPDSVAIHRAGVHAMLPFAPAIVVVLAALAYAATPLLERSRRPALLVLGTALVATLVGPFVVGLLVPGVGTNPRYSAAGVPALLAAVAVGAASGRRTAWSAAVVALAVLAGAAVHAARPLDGREDVFAAGRWLDANVPPDEPIVVTARDMATVASWHWPARRIVTYPAPDVVVRTANAAAIADALPFPPGERLIYLLGRTWDADPDDLLPGAVTLRWETCPGIDVAGIRILCLRHTVRTAESP